MLIHTGGTISMVENKQTGEINTTTEHPLKDVTSRLKMYAHIDEKVAFSLPSPHITTEHMLKLAKQIQQVSSSYDGIVVTHGTDTLEETAYFLELVLDIEIPVIITGAMRSSNEIGSDALYNLISSIRVAIEDTAKNKGVLVVMNDEIHTAKNVTKTSTSNVATFQSPQYGPIGIITKESIIFHHTILFRHTHPIQSINKNVLLLKAFAGMDGQLFQALSQTEIDGLVVEALGQGNLPKDTIEPIHRLIHHNIPVILVSRCYQGTVQPTYGYEGGGRQLKDIGVIFTNGLTGPKARIKLLIALERTTDYNTLKNIFEQEI